MVIVPLLVLTGRVAAALTERAAERAERRRGGGRGASARVSRVREGPSRAQGQELATRARPRAPESRSRAPERLARPYSRPYGAGLPGHASDRVGVHARRRDPG